MMPLPLTDIKKYFHLCSLYLLYGGVFLYFSSPSLGRPLMELFLVASAISVLWHLPSIWRSPAFILLAASVLVQVVSWIYCQENFPQYAGSAPDLKRLGHLFLFIPMAWTLKANTRSPWILMAIFFVGLCLTPFTEGGGFEELFVGERSGLGFRNAQHAAMAFAISLVALVVFRKRFFEFCSLPKAAIVAVLACAMFYCVVIVSVSNTRGVFLGLFFGVMVAALGLVLKKAKPKKREVFLVVALVMLVLASLAVTSKPLERWSSEIETVKLLVAGDTSSIPKDTSSGIRIHTWVEGLKWFGRSPLVGWGENGKNMAIKESSSLPEPIRNEFGHLHNSYIETMVNNGILGVALLVALHVWLGVTIFTGCKKMGIKDVQIFSLVAGVVWLTANFFESFMFYRTGVMVFGVGAASLLTVSGYSFGLSSRTIVNVD